MEKEEENSADSQEQGEKMPRLESKENPDKPEEQSQEDSQKGTVGQEQVHDILFNREIGWQEIIYDLINTEQLDPWDVDISILADKYLEKVKHLEETDFFVSSKVLLASSLLLRIKSEFLLSRYIKSIDEVLFGKKEDKNSGKVEEKIEVEEDKIPKLVPKTPAPRLKKVGLNELMQSLNKAIETENRRIKKEIVKKNAVREAGVSVPKKKKASIKDKIKTIFSKLKSFFENAEEDKKVNYESLIENKKEEKILSLSPVLHLEHQKEVWIEQERPFGNVHIWDIEDYRKKKGDPVQKLVKEFEIEQGPSEENPNKKSKAKKTKKKKSR